MIKAPIPHDEEKRLESVRNLNILDTKEEERFDIITENAVKELKVPISTITIMDKDREWFKSCQGLDVRESPREISFCGHALVSESVMIVEDTLEDERFKDNPMVVNAPHIRFYAGVRLFNRKDRMPVGVFCVKDTVPRKFSMDEIAKLLDFAEKAEEEINK